MHDSSTIEMCALASGSNGNCYYIGNHNDAVLIDAGISTRQLMLRFRQTGLDPSKVKAVFISHEHSDHARGMQVLSKKLGISVYMTTTTYYALPRPFRPDFIKFFKPGETIHIGTLAVHSFLKNHDAAEPCSFRIEHNGKSVGVLTDIGEPCSNVTGHVSQCNALFLESNYDEKMLMNGNYPWYLKTRVSSAKGHLSNMQALQLVQEHAGPGLECIFLSHLSQENNTPEIAIAAFEPVKDKFRIKLTHRHQPAEVYTLGPSIQRTLFS